MALDSRIRFLASDEPGPPDAPEHSWQVWQQSQANAFNAYKMQSPYDLGRMMKKPPRNTFTPEQLRILNVFFQVNKYLTKESKEVISARTNLTQRQVKIWFQNQRYKSKKTTPVLNKANN
ncbi:hypothetical protein L596_023852 [Steinernema carpocapsae]|uniref:Homeobox domain-containing protein n=1 Tax=Steinernema carpocapsae TaxID=34508 RepID=A0A4U5MF55_STECR|nr:hypothetical protein L596_023852 [Steinernema carpocapsae]